MEMNKKIINLILKTRKRLKENEVIVYLPCWKLKFNAIMININL